ncbi:MAG: hypothetical protein ABI776_19765, partial [Nocardioidaceae bacterium]
MTTRRTPGADVHVVGGQTSLFEDSDVPEFGKALAGAMTRSVRHPRDLTTAGLTYAGSMAKLGSTA